MVKFAKILAYPLVPLVKIFLENFTFNTSSDCKSNKDGTSQTNSWSLD